jgi:3-deoxy-D-arabino-heptulosonate 7-phosphate (DAHP) synthase class II
VPDAFREQHKINGNLHQYPTVMILQNHLGQLLQKLKKEGAQIVIHCGDLIGGNTLRASSP